MSFEENIASKEENIKAHFHDKWRLLCILSLKYFCEATQPASIFLCLQMMGHLLVQKKKNWYNLLAQVSCHFTSFSCPPGGVTPLYQVYRYVPPQRVWFLSCFGLKTGIDFEHFGLRLGMVIGGTFTKACNLSFLPSNWGE